jgi:hypothetical protein
MSPGSVERPVYPVATRLLRIVSVLIEKFYTLLVIIHPSLFQNITII